MPEPNPKATILDIARALNVSTATVSRALNNHPAISAATKQSVEKAAQTLKYHPNGIATSLRSGKSNIIGAIIPSAEINFFGSVVHGIEKIATENAYNVLIFQSNELYEYEKRGVQTFLRAQVAGVLASISKETINLDHYRELNARGIPLIFFDRVDDSLDVPSIMVNDYAGAFKATKHLIEQGCRRIAHIGGQQHVTIFNRRLKGYIDALNVHAIPIDEDLIVYGKVSIESGRQCMARLLAQGHPPDAVFAVEDFTALGALQALKAAQKKVPGDVAVVGFANEAFGEYLTPSLSTVNQHTVQMGEAAAGLLFRILAHGDAVPQPPQKLVLEPELICRQSSLKYPVS